MISQQTIDQVKEALIKEYNPVEIYLFGSYAWGHPTEDSDLDILVVVDKPEGDRIKMIVLWYHILANILCPKDILIYTKDEFDEWSQEVPRLSYKIKKRGKKIYAKQDD
jgi:predicted nucleotidyltransferase